MLGANPQELDYPLQQPAKSQHTNSTRKKNIEKGYTSMFL